jgi:hypothetical protein
MKKNSIATLLAIKQSMAELDWILPVCFELKQLRPESPIYCVFLKFDKDSIIKGNRFMLSIAEETFDSMLDATDLLPAGASKCCRATQNLHKRIKGKFAKPKTTYREWQLKNISGDCKHQNNDSDIKLKTILIKIKKRLRHFFALCKAKVLNAVLARTLLGYIKAKRVHLLMHTMHASTFPPLVLAVRHLRQTGGLEVAYPPSTNFFSPLQVGECDLLLTNANVALDNETPPKTTLRHVGVPRYDQAWTNRLKAAFQTTEQAQAHPRVLVNLQKEYAWIFSKKRFEQYFDDILNVLDRFPAGDVVIKPHPSQDLAFLRSRIADFSACSIRIDNSSTLALSAQSDCIITQPSTSINDTLPFGKPVVEYFDYRDIKHYFDHADAETITAKWEVYRERNGEPLSIYQDLGLVSGARSKEELEEAMSHIWGEDQSVSFQAWRKMFPDGASQRAAQAVLDMLDQPRRKPNPQEQHTDA